MSRPEQDLLLSMDGVVATLTINRPAKRNALTVTMWRRVAQVCAELATDPRLRMLVVTGAGASFCAGADISSLTEDEATLKSVVETAELALRNLPIPTVAKIRGPLPRRRQPDSTRL
jgi:enoyl-CoA hydratase/carnithine racemase